MAATKVRIYVNQQFDGMTYELDPMSKVLVEKQVTDTAPVSRLFISYEDKDQVEWMHGPVRKQVAQLLTGLPWEKIEALGGAVFVDPKTNKTILDMAEQNV